MNRPEGLAREDTSIMAEKEKLGTLVSLIANLDEKNSLELTRQLISEGVSPLEIIEHSHKGMIEVGLFYEKGIYFISGLIMAGEIVQQISQFVLPLTRGDSFQKKMGRMVVGTVEGDIHCIGKDIFKAFMGGHGFAVHDLGVDVSKSRFLDAIHEFKPEIVGISCLISSCIDTLQETISHLKANTPGEIAPRAYVAGGRLLNQRVGKAVGADLCTTDAMEGVRLCQHAMKGGHSPGSTP